MLMVVNLYFFIVVLKKVNCNVNGCEPIFFHCSIKKVKAVVVVIISMIHMQTCVFLMLLKI